MTNYNAIKTDLAIQYTQDQLITGDLITIKSFGVASEAGALDSSRTIEDINTTWFSTQFTSTNITTSTVTTGVTELGLEMIVPASIPNLVGTNYMTEFYIIGRYQNNDFLFGIMQTQLVNKLIYVDNTAYTYDVNFDLSNYTDALNITVNMLYNLSGGNYVLQDGSTPFLAEQGGIAAISDNSLVTLGQVKGLISNISTGNPDYENPINKAWNTLHTATEDGWVEAYAVVFSGGGTRYAYLNINSTAHKIHYANSGGDAHSAGCTLMLRVKSGDTYSGTEGSEGQVLKFYPMEGA